MRANLESDATQAAHKITRGCGGTTVEHTGLVVFVVYSVVPVFVNVHWLPYMLFGHIAFSFLHARIVEKGKRYTPYGQEGVTAEKKMAKQILYEGLSDN